LHPTLSRRFRTNDRALQYRRLSHEVYTDTMKAKSISWFRQNKYAQVFCTRFGWTQIYPMRLKSEAHLGLSLMFNQDGVLPLIIMDGSKEQTMGQFCMKAREANCQIKETEPHSPWQNAAESAIRETKCAAGRKMVASKCPQRIWDHCIELGAMIWSHTVLDSFELQGQVPETIVSLQTADISLFIEYAWFAWIIYYDRVVSFPDLKEQLGQWLGPAIDLRPAMTAKILKANGQDNSTHRSLTDAELDDMIQISARDAYMTQLNAVIYNCSE
jgi:hypothetical protein